MLRSSMAQAKKGRILSPGHVAQLASVVLAHQGCGLDLWSGRTQESTNGA